MRALCRWVAVFLAAGLLFVGCGSAPGGAAGASAGGGLDRVGQLSADDQQCSRDVECALVQDCCGCQAGGMNTGVRADRLEAVVERTASECEARSCGTQASAHRSCSATAAQCLGGRCVPAL